MTELNELVIEKLKLIGWNQDRDVFDNLIRPDKSTIFGAAKNIVSQYGLLKLEFLGKSGNETLYFDIDNSETSRNLRADIFGYDNYKDISKDDEPDFKLDLDQELENNIKDHIGKTCTYIGFKDDHLGFDLFVTDDGSIYSAHGTTADKQASSFEEYLNNIIIQ